MGEGSEKPVNCAYTDKLGTFLEKTGYLEETGRIPASDTFDAADTNIHQRPETRKKKDVKDKVFWKVGVRGWVCRSGPFVFRVSDPVVGVRSAKKPRFVSLAAS